MTDSRIALLRGINVGTAKRIAMADLRKLVEGLGYGDVRTLLNSGNVVFTVPKGVRGDAAARIEKAIAARLGVKTRVTVVKGGVIAAAVRENPLKDVASNDSLLLVLVPADRTAHARLKPLLKERWAPEALALGKQVAYLWCARGSAESPLWAAVNRLLGEQCTARNMATMTKLAALVEDAPTGGEGSMMSPARSQRVTMLVACLAVFGVTLASVALSAPADDARGVALSPAAIDAIYSDVEALYIDLHQHPELAFQETRTAAKLAGIMTGLGFDVTTGVGRTGIVAVMKNGPGPVAMLRTDLDALPVAEETGLPFASVAKAEDTNGQAIPVMHACGHDIHMAAWVGAARLMAANRGRWSGTLLMVGQPAEEVGAGATAMLKDGLFTRFPRPDFALALHVDDTMPAGTIGYHPGLFRAVSDTVSITVYGRGGHAAMPHNTVDPVVLAARIVLTLQTVVSRENNPIDPVVITVGSIHGGTRANIVPDEVRLELSVRTLKPEVRERTLAAIRRIAKGEADASGAPKEPLVSAPEVARPPVINDPELTLRLAEALKKALGEAKVVEMSSKMTSEDFAEYGAAGVPAVLLHIGAVEATKLALSRQTGIPVPAPHSPQWAPEREPTLKAAIRAETAALLALFAGN